MNDTLLEIKADIKEIKGQVGELVKQGAVHNHVLTTHEQRSTTLKRELDARVEPLEDDFVFRRKLYVLIMGSSGILAIIALCVSVATLLLHRQ